MKKSIDLQMHSHYSDGSKSPTQLVELLRSKNIVVASLTDHNTIHGQYEFQAAAKKYRIKTIPGVEIYTTYKKWRLHLLGYNIDVTNAELHDRLRETQIKRKKLIESVVPKLKRRGITLDISELFAKPATYIGIANIYRLLKSKPKNHKIFQTITKKADYDVYDVYNNLFHRGSSCHLPEVSIPIRSAMNLIKRCGGVPVLSHPGWHLKFREDKVITDLKKLGLRGIECFNSHHNWDQTAHYIKLAKANNLIITAGSDYHGDLPGDHIIENYHEYTSLPYEIYEKIKAF